MKTRVKDNKNRALPIDVLGNRSWPGSGYSSTSKPTHSTKRNKNMNRGKENFEDRDMEQRLALH